MKQDPFKLKQPCKDCPFRRDSMPGWLGARRAREIADSVYEENGMGGGNVFPCHKTVDYSGEDEERHGGPLQPSNAYCAGALAVVEKEVDERGLPLPVQMAERLGMYDASTMKIDDSTFDSFDEFVEHHGREFSAPE